LLYARLPAGSYMLFAELGGQSKEQKLTITAPGKPLALRLSWKAE